MCGAKLFSKMLSGGQNPQLHTVTLHLVCGIRNGGGELKKEGGTGRKRRGERGMKLDGGNWEGRMVGEKE